MSEFVMTAVGLEDIQTMLKDVAFEVPSAVRNALNDTARDIQRDTRAGLNKKFDVRKKSFIERQVYIAPEDKATRDKWSTRVQIRGPGGQTSTLEKFESVGKKVARQGRIAVPAKDFRTGGGHVKPEIALDKLLPLVQMGGQYTKLRKTKGGLVRGKTFTSKQQLVGKRGTFLVTLKGSGLEALVRRAKGQPKGWNKTEILWVFKKSVDVGKPLRFVFDATGLANRFLPVRAGEAIEAALKRARAAPTR